MDLIDFVKVATTAPSADNSQPWRFAVRDRLLECSYSARHGTVDVFGEMGHGSLIAAGALHENIDRLTGRDGSATVRWNTDEQAWQLCLPLDRLDAITGEQVAAIEARHTNRHPFRRELSTPLPQPNGTRPGVRSILLQDKRAIGELTHALRTCSEARFNDPDLHGWLFSSMRWTEEEASEGHGLDVATVHLPPGGRWFMRWIAPWERMRTLNRLGLYRLMALADTAPFGRGPAVIAICGGDTAEEIWDAGRMLQDVWIELNKSGLAVHPYYALTDLTNRLRSGRIRPEWRQPVAMAESRARAVLDMRPDERLHMLLRVGMPTVAPVRSRRMPPARFLS